MVLKKDILMISVYKSLHVILHLENMFHQLLPLQPLSTKNANPSQPLLLLLDVRSHLAHRPLGVLTEHAVEGAVVAPTVLGKKCSGAACLWTGRTGKGARV